MIEPASLIGFALAFLAATWIASAALGLGYWAFRRRLASAGPAVERAASATAIVFAPLVGVAITVALASSSLQNWWRGVDDHCLSNGHHPHLCLEHGGAWSGEVWALVALGVVAAFLLTATVRRATSLWSTAIATRRFVSAAGPANSREVVVVESDRSFCFVSGFWRPRIYVSTLTWAALDEDERAALLAHERAHIAQGDTRWSVALDALTLLGAPSIASGMFKRWRSGTERLCDARAAQVTHADSVALALVKVARLGAACKVPALVGFSGHGDVVERVEALLASRPIGAHKARTMVRITMVSALALIAAAMLLSDPLHHSLETLLGVF